MHWQFSLSSRVRVRLEVKGGILPSWAAEFLNNLTTAGERGAGPQIRILAEFEEFEGRKSGPPLVVESREDHVYVSSVDLEGRGNKFSWEARIAGPGGLQNMLLAAVSFAVPFMGEVLIHASSCEKGEKAAVFPGLSGAGKSTISTLLRQKGWNLLGDDLVLLTNKKTVEGVKGVQTFGPEGLLREYPAFIFFLKKSDNPLIEEVPLPRARALLLQSIPFVHVCSSVYDRVMDIIDEVIRKTDTAYMLHFDKKGLFIPILEEVLR